MKLALVTGTTRGIGLTLARELLTRGWNVMGFARSSAPEELAGHAAYEHVSVDLAELPALESAARTFAANSGLRDAQRFALVNNAGVLQPMRQLEGVPLEDLERAFRINTVAPVWLMGFALAERARGPLTIVNLSSGAATKAYPSWAAYCATKAALKMAGEVAAAELEAAGEDPTRRVAIVSYAPHVVATGMQAEIRSTPAEHFPLRERFVELHESGALVAPEGPARAIADLCQRDDLPLWTETRFTPS